MERHMKPMHHEQQPTKTTSKPVTVMPGGSSSKTAGCSSRLTSSTRETMISATMKAMLKGVMLESQQHHRKLQPLTRSTTNTS